MHRFSGSRSAFLIGVGTSAVIYSKLAVAQVAVFDAAAYASAINSIAKQTIIATQTIKGVQTALDTYQFLLNDRRLTIGQIFSIARPYLQDLAKVANINVSVPLSADQLLLAFQRSFPEWTPGQPYGDLYANALRNARLAIANTLQVAQATHAELQSKSVTLSDLANAVPNTQADALRLGHMLSVQLNDNILGLSGTIASQTASQANFMNAKLAADEERRRSPAYAQLQSTFAAIPRQLKAAVK